MSVIGLIYSLDIYDMGLISPPCSVDKRPKFEDIFNSMNQRRAAGFRAAGDQVKLSVYGNSGRASGVVQSFQYEIAFSREAASELCAQLQAILNDVPETLKPP